MKKQKKAKSNVEYWVHWVCDEAWYELPPEERKKCIHACKMVYVDSTKRQYFSWGGSWHGIHPVCFCGHHFKEYEIMEEDEYLKWRKSILESNK
jgi:hypothetical protein